MKFLFFWGHQPEHDGSIGKGCLSQWWPCSFVVEGQQFASAEHYMMWRKALLFNDLASASRMLAARTPAEAKALGRSISDFSSSVWESQRLPIVVDGNLAKFGQDPALRSYLLGTGSRVLVEASPQDRVWGIGLVASDPRASDPSAWLGLNLLGEALMEVRSRLSAA
ncbi:NADAR family protein [Lentzea sp. BCCO 10_0856]|uniref:NADAR family protein n=1 Tax=Lentzea miocenica TaxID=3095431 RepID=A0ABU4TCP8_9PSEU|nr:NADAR family protein [Lentzea sp. BCCO 10_0856]MDX8035956.1 NADAR family protein [Lentzea sp. BCCO 10_0856]